MRKSPGYTGPIKLDGDPRGAKVLILGAGPAGITAALEMRATGCSFELREYRDKAGAAVGPCVQATAIPNWAVRRRT